MFARILTIASLMLALSGTAQAQSFTYLSTSPSAMTSGDVTQGTYDYYRFYKYSGHKYTVCLKPSSGDPDLFGHWTTSVSRYNFQFDSQNYNLEYDCISFEAGQSGWYYLAVYGTYAAYESDYEIYVVGADMDIPWQLEGQLRCPFTGWYSSNCGQLTSNTYGPFASTWGNFVQRPFFDGDYPGQYDDYFHLAVDWKKDKDR